MSLLHLCILRSHFQALISVLGRFPNVNITIDDECTPLSLAIMRGSLHLAAMILRSGANPNVTDLLDVLPLFPSRRFTSPRNA
jgi:ankyrin repeat protein